MNLCYRAKLSNLLLFVNTGIPPSTGSAMVGLGCNLCYICEDYLTSEFLLLFCFVFRHVILYLFCPATPENLIEETLPGKRCIHPE